MELRKRLYYSELRQHRKEDIKAKYMEYDNESSSHNLCTLPLSDPSSSEQEMDLNVQSTLDTSNFKGLGKIC